VATNPSCRRISDEREEDLVTVFDTNDEAEALVVQGLLDANGIESLRTNLDAPQDVLPGVGGVVLRVRASDAEEARRIIEEQRSDAQLSEESTDEEIS
jgi:hypothetical protein